MKNNFKGLIAAPYTPMNADGSINLQMIGPYTEGLLDNKIQGAFVGGTTGESASLTVDEKKKINEEWVRYASGRMNIIAHVGGVCQQECVELAEHALDCGVDSVAAMSPYFFQPETTDDLIQFLEPIAKAAGILPFYYYHIPSMTGVNFPVHKLLKKVKKSIPNFVGVKYTHSDLMDLQQCLNASNNKYDIKYGSDETLICGLSLGVKTAIGSTYNFMPSIYQDLIEAFQDNDLALARQKQMISIQVVDILFRHGGPVRAGKAIMEFIGLDCGPCRSPINKMTEADRSALLHDLNEIDFFEAIKYVYSS